MTTDAASAGPFRIAAFLGNPGRKYRDTRHNLAWRILEACSIFPSLSWSDKFNGSYAVYSSPEGSIILLRPNTFMNKSGICVGAAARYYKADPAEILVIHDDLELPFGEVRLKSGGGNGGHNGLKSVTSGLGTNAFPRFRLGIGRPGRGTVSSYVLSRFSPDEEYSIDRYISRAAELTETLIDGKRWEHGQSSVPLV